jgi:hypothetical protein
MTNLDKVDTIEIIEEWDTVVTVTFVPAEKGICRVPLVFRKRYR